MATRQSKLVIHRFLLPQLAPLLVLVSLTVTATAQPTHPFLITKTADFA